MNHVMEMYSHSYESQLVTGKEASPVPFQSL